MCVRAGLQEGPGRARAPPPHLPLRLLQVHRGRQGQARRARGGRARQLRGVRGRVHLGGARPQVLLHRQADHPQRGEGGRAEYVL